MWALKSYTKRVPLYVQVIQQSSVKLIAPFLDPEQDVLVSTEQTRQRMLALSCLCPGASTLIGGHPGASAQKRKSLSLCLLQRFRQAWTDVFSADNVFCNFTHSAYDQRDIEADSGSRHVRRQTIEA